MDTPILSRLKTLAKKSEVRFCMPGHKGKAGVFFNDVLQYDITEISGADNLCMPEGIIKKSQDLYAESVGAKHSFYSINGSTSCVQAALMSVLGQGDKVIVARDIHMSAIHAFVLVGVRPFFVKPSAKMGRLPCVVSPNDIREAIIQNPDAKAVYITYPNYYGLCVDLKEICEIAHLHGMQVICDGAHAAAFDFSDLLPMSPAECGCDIFSASLHKTLPAMNQCAVLSIGKNAKIRQSTVSSRLRMLQSTSPSYLLLASCDFATASMREEGKQKIADAVAKVEYNIEKIEAIGGLFCVTKDVPKNTGAVDRDILRLVIDVTNLGISGIGAARELEKHGVFVEAADSWHIVLICTIQDTKEDFVRLTEALLKLKGANYTIEKENVLYKLEDVFSQQPVIDMRRAAFAKSRRVRLEDSVGEIATVCVGAYPPGVPIIMPGMKITYSMVDYLIHLRNHGYGLFGLKDGVEVIDREYDY